MKRKIKILITTFFIIVIFAMLSILFVFPLLYEKHQGINLFATIIILFVIIFSIEEVVKLSLRRDKKN